MSYQDYLKSTQNHKENSATSSPSQSPVHTIHRKPTANYSPIPFPTNSGSVSKTVSQFNNLRSASMSSQGPAVTPVTSMSKRSFSPTAPATPLSLPKPTAEPVSNSMTPPAPVSAASSTNGIIDYPPPPPHAEWHPALKSCLALQTDAVTHHNKRPFAALLLGPDKATILHSSFSISHVQHAESELARLASSQYSTEYLRKCTLVSTWEPCAMCAGTIYWTGIGRVVYAASESKLRDVTGPGNSENMTMDLPCRTVFNAGQTKVEVVGPVPGWEEKVVDESRKWWKDHKLLAVGPLDGTAVSSTNSVKSASTRSYTVVTNPPPEEGVLSRIGEDGEYKADLKVDWMTSIL